MNARPLLVTAFVALGLVQASACSGGSAPGLRLPTGAKEPAGGGNEPGNTGGAEPSGGNGYEPPGSSGYEQPGGSGSSGGTSSSSGGQADCLVCTTYNCTVSANGQPFTFTLTLSPQGNGACGADVSTTSITLLCGGAIVSTSDGGSAQGTWQATGGGGFSASSSSGTLTCVPASSTSGSGSGGGSSGAGGPPVVVGIDAG